jgi:4-hydroxy-3-methylbut-2-enyl diphosphate reductase
LAREVDLILVVGAQNSSNSNRLREIGEATGTPSYLIDNADSLDPAWLDGAAVVGITAGASAPELLVQELIARLGDHYAVAVETLDGIEENVHFRLPSGLAERVQPGRPA